MIKRQNLYFIVYYLLVFSLVPSLLYGETAKVGKSGLLASIFVEKTYDDNIFLTKQNKKSDRILNVIPSIFFAKNKNNLYFNLQYGAHLMYYDNYSQENQYYQTGTWDMGISPGTKSKIGVRGTDTYSYVKVDEREPRLSNNINKQNDLSVNPYMEKKWGKRFKSLLNYTYSEKAYSSTQKSEKAYSSTQKEDKDLEDSKNQRGNADFYYTLSKRISIEGGYRYSFTNFANETPDYSEQEVGGGLALELMRSKVKMHGRVGHVWKKDELEQKNEYESIDSKIDISLLKETLITAGYTKSSSYLSTHDPNNDFYISHTASLNIQHKVLHQKITATYGLAYNFLDFQSSEKMDRSYTGTARINWKLFKPIILSLNGDWKISHYTYQLEDRRDRSSGGGAGLTWKIFQPVTLLLQGKYTRSNYEPEARQDELYDGSYTFSYAISRNTFLEIGHQYLQNESVYKKVHLHNPEDDVEEYVNHKYNVGLKAVF